ncbi:winged helix-turn-helix domain-containing protein [Burkholderia contaminans]|uniref:winged helix-turn-helix transcriptional regulator n=1 Tax=Burkholderia TaxID=32008 RepID=UPI00197F6337|nr:MULTISPECIES: winged helix-turn-helix domain-containing protein [Burkholderia]MBN3747111.1 winged helix-turn-helix domain-containing protein [Burkholderia sp. Se-20373]MCA7883219.1 winged helix-turn-helix domain-containing protein [Burkholderia contaminans]
MADGKVGPVSKQIIECVKANPGIHAGEIARRLGLSLGGGPRETIRNLIAAGYLKRGEKVTAAGTKGHAASPLMYTGKRFKGFDKWAGSDRWRRIQERIAAEAARERQAIESIEWAERAIRAMVETGRAAA